MITLDLRRHGRSDKPHQASAYGLEFFVADVLAVLDRLEVERFAPERSHPGTFFFCEYSLE